MGFTPAILFFRFQYHQFQLVVLNKIQKRYPYGLLGQGFVGKLTIKYPCGGPLIFVLLTAAARPYLLRLRMAIAMQRISPPYKTRQPNININHADSGINYSP